MITSASHNNYRASEELADDAIHWLSEHKRFSPEKPLLIIRRVGHRTAPHQTPKERVDKPQAQVASLVGAPPSALRRYHVIGVRGLDQGLRGEIALVGSKH